MKIQFKADVHPGCREITATISGRLEELLEGEEQMMNGML